MVRYVPDRTGRSARRPHYQPEEIDKECEDIVQRFLIQRYGEAKFPISTDDLTRLIERDSDDLDLYADLSEFGQTVEGMTEFQPGRRPLVRISASLANDGRRENRLRTTLTHEYGHVHFHSDVWDAEQPQGCLFVQRPTADRQTCKRDAILNATQGDWMEWQASYACGAFLMPPSQVRRLVGEYREVNGLFGDINHTDQHGRALVAEMQTAFQVSADAARVRLLRLEALTPTAIGPPLLTR